MKASFRAVTLLVAVSVALASCAGGQGAEVAEDELARVSVGDLTASVGATGTVRPDQLTMLTFKTSGVVGEVYVEVGDTVGSGDRLADLVDASLPASVLLARADLVSAQRALEDVLSSEAAAAQALQAVADAREALDKAERDYTWNQEGNRATSDTLKAAKAKLAVERERMERARDAYASTSGSLSEGGARAQAFLAYNNARIAYQRALGSYNWYTGHPTEVQQTQLEADVALARARLADAERAYGRLQDGPDPDEVAAAEARVAAAESTVQQARVVAPFAGTITAVEVQPGDSVSPGSVAFQLADLSRLLVDVDISEIDINRVRSGQPAQLTFDGILDRSYQGEVAEVAMVGITNQGVVSFRVTLVLTEPDALVRPGLTAAVNLLVDQLEEVLLVPNRAVRVRDGNRVVYLLREGEIVMVPIVLGVSSETESQVVQGDLQAGDTILLNPPTEFEPSGGPGGFFSNQ